MANEKLKNQKIVLHDSHPHVPMDNQLATFIESSEEKNHKKVRYVINGIDMHFVNYFVNKLYICFESTHMLVCRKCSVIRRSMVDQCHHFHQRLLMVSGMSLLFFFSHLVGKIED